MNKPQITTIYGVYSTDDRGYIHGKALAYYPIKAAAEAFKGDRYNFNVYQAESLRFEDTLYLLEKELSKTAKIVGKIPAFVPAVIYQNYKTNSYHADISDYYCDGADFLAELKVNENLTLYKKVMICDTEGNFYLLRQIEPITVEKLAMSRELAVAHALSKLTDEEKKLLGI